MKNAEYWIEAARILMENPRAQVICPQCGLSFLEVEDEQVDPKHFDRHLLCPTCGARSSVFKRIEKS